MRMNLAWGRNTIVAVAIMAAVLRHVDAAGVPAAFLGSSKASSSTSNRHSFLQNENYYPQQRERRSRARTVATTQSNWITTSPHPLRGTAQDDTEDSEDSDDSDKSPTTTRFGEPMVPEKRLYTYEELQSNPELREMEANQAKQRYNLWSVPGRIGGALTAAGWLFVIVSTILNTQGYAWIPSTNGGGFSLGTLEERNFAKTMSRTKQAATTTKSTLLEESSEKPSSTAANELLLEQSKSTQPP